MRTKDAHIGLKYPHVSVAAEGTEWVVRPVDGMHRAGRGAREFKEAWEEDS